MDMGDGGCVEYILYVINGAGRGGAGRVRQYPNPSRVLKIFSKPVPNPVIKIDPRPIRGRAGRVPEKTCPIAIPMCTLVQQSYTAAWSKLKVGQLSIQYPRDFSMYQHHICQVIRLISGGSNASSDHITASSAKTVDPCNSVWLLCLLQVYCWAQNGLLPVKYFDGSIPFALL